MEPPAGRETGRKLFVLGGASKAVHLGASCSTGCENPVVAIREVHSSESGKPTPAAGEADFLEAATGSTFVRIGRGDAGHLSTIISHFPEHVVKIV